VDQTLESPQLGLVHAVDVRRRDGLVLVHGATWALAVWQSMAHAQTSVTVSKHRAVRSLRASSRGVRPRAAVNTKRFGDPCADVVGRVAARPGSRRRPWPREPWLQSGPPSATAQLATAANADLVHGKRDGGARCDDGRAASPRACHRARAHTKYHALVAADDSRVWSVR
jgi:hypothetical protein